MLHLLPAVVEHRPSSRDHPDFVREATERLLIRHAALLERLALV